MYFYFLLDLEVQERSGMWLMKNRHTRSPLEGHSMTRKPGSPFDFNDFSLNEYAYRYIINGEEGYTVYLYMKYFSWTHTFFWLAPTVANPDSNKMKEKKVLRNVSKSYGEKTWKKKIILSVNIVQHCYC